MRKLTLKKETITELGGDDLAAVVGANNTQKICISGIVECVPSRDCPTRENCVDTLECTATLNCG